MLERLQKIIADAKGDKNIKVEPGMVLLTDLKLDSFDLATVVSEIEMEFKIKVNDRDINRIKTVQDVLDYITEKNGK